MYVRVVCVCVLQMRYYQLQRQHEASAGISSGGASNSGGRVTVRALESSVRLAEAHAKLMCHHTVTFEVSSPGLKGCAVLACLYSCLSYRLRHVYVVMTVVVV